MVVVGGECEQRMKTYLPCPILRGVGAEAGQKAEGKALPSKY